MGRSPGSGLVVRPCRDPRLPGTRDVQLVITCPLQYDLYDEEEGVCLEGVVVIDREGVVRHAMTTSLGYEETAESALEVVRLLQGCDISGVDRLGREKTFHLPDYRGSYLVCVFYPDNWESRDQLAAFSLLAPKFRRQVSAGAEGTYNLPPPRASSWWAAPAIPPAGTARGSAPTGEEPKVLTNLTQGGGRVGR